MLRDGDHDLSLLDSSVDAEAVGYLSFAPIQVLDSKETYLTLKIPGDGNCGFYSFAIGLINLIVQDQLAMSDEQYRRLIGQLSAEDGAAPALMKRLQFFKTGKTEAGTERIQLKSCLSPMRKILQAFAQGQLKTFQQFKDYLLANNDYYPNLAMIIILGPILRKLSVEIGKACQGTNRIEGAESAAIIEVEAADGVDADVGQIHLLGTFFDVDLIAYKYHGNEIKRDVQAYEYNLPQHEVNEDKAEENKAEHEARVPVDTRRNQIAIVHKRGPHWDCLIPSRAYSTPPFYFSRFSFAEQKEGNAELNALKENVTAMKGRLFDFTQAVNKLVREFKLSSSGEVKIPKNERIQYEHKGELKEVDRASPKVKDSLSDDGMKKKLITILKANLNTLFLEDEKHKTVAFARCYDALYDAQQVLVAYDLQIRVVIADLVKLQQEYRPIRYELLLNKDVKLQNVPDGGALLDFDVKADGNCMFYSVGMSFLLSAINDEYLFYSRYKLVTDNRDASLEKANELRGILQYYDGSLKFFSKFREQLTDIINIPFRGSLVDFMRDNKLITPDIIPQGQTVEGYYFNMRQEKTWGGEPELYALSQKLKVRIKVYPGSKDRLELPRIFGENFSDEINLVHVATEGDGNRNHYHFLMHPNCFTSVSLADKLPLTMEKRPDSLSSVSETMLMTLTKKIDTVADRDFKAALMELAGDFRRDVTTVALLQHTVRMLDVTSGILTAEKLDQATKKRKISTAMDGYLRSCQASPGYQEVSSTIYKVFMAGLGALLGAIVGIGIGFLFGCLPGAVATGAEFAGMGAGLGAVGFFKFRSKSEKLAEDIRVVMDRGVRSAG